MNKFILTTTIFALLLQTGFTQTIRDYKLSGFKNLSIGSAVHVYVKQGSQFNVSSKGRKEDIDELEVYVRNNTLIVESKSKWGGWNRSNNQKVEFQIEMPIVSSLSFSGATNSVVTGFDDLEHINIDLSGASKSKIDVFANTTKIDVSGASKLKMVGRANKLDMDLSGASSVDALNYPVQSADIEASGASNTKVSVSKLLNAEASGAANIKFSGNPKLHKSTSGGAHVQGI